MDALKLLNKLQVKSDLVQWNNDSGKEYFVLVAKKVGGKESLRKEEGVVFDMDDLVGQVVGLGWIYYGLEMDLIPLTNKYEASQ